VLLEQLFSMLLAPPMMVFHSTFVVSTLAGRPVAWNTQERGDRGVTLLQALARHKWHILLGIAWGAAILLIVPKYIWWMSPVLAGLLLSAPFTMVSSRAGIGRFLRRCGLLLTPEEVAPPPELVAAHLPFARPSDPGGTPVHPGEGGAPAVPSPAPLVMDPTPPLYVGLRGALQRRAARLASTARAASLRPPPLTRHRA
jgi:membrane glycosyltransferase